MNDATKLKVWGVTMLGFLMGMAMLVGINGVLFSLVVAAIAGLCGYELAKAESKRD
jgi:hypothetical protein